jgi:hypothetical protein
MRVTRICALCGAIIREHKGTLNIAQYRHLEACHGAALAMHNRTADAARKAAEAVREEWRSFWRRPEDIPATATVHLEACHGASLAMHKRTADAARKAAYDAAYNAAQAGGMNELESHEFATEQAERATARKLDTNKKETNKI